MKPSPSSPSDTPAERSVGTKTDPGVDDLTARDLLAQARAARQHAYAPYSDFPVGAALLASDGRVFTGVNVENASYGLATCAERTAVVSAVTAGARDFVAIAVIGPEDEVPCPPCGSCRQILYEVAPDLLIITAREGEEAEVTPLGELLPRAFGPGTHARGSRRP